MVIWLAVVVALAYTQPGIQQSETIATIDPPVPAISMMAAA
jgi:hypothetical protein